MSKKKSKYLEDEQVRKNIEEYYKSEEKQSQESQLKEDKNDSNQKQIDTKSTPEKDSSFKFPLILSIILLVIVSPLLLLTFLAGGYAIIITVLLSYNLIAVLAVIWFLFLLYKVLINKELRKNYLLLAIITAMIIIAFNYLTK